MAIIDWVRTRRKLGACLLGLLCIAVLDPAMAQDAAALRARHAALREQLANNQFQRPLYLESVETSSELKGEIYASIEQPFATVRPALQGMDHWCDILILHLNVKYCKGSSAGTADTLTMVLGRKYDQPVEEAHGVTFSYKTGAANPDYLQVLLNADSGPLGTRNYRIMLEAVPLDARRTFLHMSYSYGYGMAARIAMQGYLATTGRGKVGFSVVGKQADGRPVYIGDVRGVVERNTMRYYLAIEAYLSAVNLPYRSSWKSACKSGTRRSSVTRRSCTNWSERVPRDETPRSKAATGRRERRRTGMRADQFFRELVRLIRSP
jgi:hypothetical protein